MLADVDFDDEVNFYVMGHSDRTGRGRLGVGRRQIYTSAIVPLYASRRDRSRRRNNSDSVRCLPHRAIDSSSVGTSSLVF